VCFERQDLAVDSKISDAHLSAEFKGFLKASGIVKADFGQTLSLLKKREG
jgi:hypothetical protein